MNLSIDTLAIRQDAQGRFSLNDLYQASGGQQKHRPKYWLANAQTKALIAEVLRRNSAPELSANSCLSNNTERGGIPPRSVPPVFTEPTRNPGTWVARPLVYAYAMWVSPAFHLKVIETFDAAVTDGFVKPSIQAENFWFSLRPHWRKIRDMAASGMRYTEIALVVGRSADSVGRCVRRMIEVGLINPTALFLARFKPITAKRIVSESQLCLSWGATA